MKATLAPPAAGSLARRLATPVAAPRLTSVIGNRATREALASANTQPRSLLPPVLAGSGDSMPSDVQRKMEIAFAADFSNVRVHEGAQPTAIGALAYAQGSDLHFAPGQYQPHSPRGQELLGHELAHVVQQAQGRVAANPQAKGSRVNDDVALEREADELGARAARGASAVLRGGGIPQAPAAPPAPGVVVQASYTPKKKEREELKRRVASWGKEYTKAGGELDQLVNDLAEYCDNHTQALHFIEKATYEEWSQAQLGGTSATDFDTQLLGVGVDEPEAKAKVDKDPLDEVRKQLQKQRIDPSLFHPNDLKRIYDLKSKVSWDSAIRDIYQEVKEAKENEAAEQRLVQTYAGDKRAGDQIFTSELLMEVWNLSYKIATLPMKNVNATLPREYDDGVILDAVQRWSAQGNLAKVTKFHVPGGNEPIQDKSTRRDNPDSSRGRQCDFISHWQGNKINVHVDSTRHHD